MNRFSAEDAINYILNTSSEEEGLDNPSAISSQASDDIIYSKFYAVLQKIIFSCLYRSRFL